MMVEMIVWSGDFDKKTVAGKDFVNRAKKKRQELLSELEKKLRESHLSV
jgi:hypothetical protein